MKLILGDGLLGTELYKVTNWDFISRKKDNFNFNKNNFLDFIDDKYTTIINCIADTQTYSNNKKSHMTTNYKSVMNLVDFCNKFQKKLIHISTDYVYINTKSMASEEDIPIHYNNLYIYSKILADEYIQARSNDYLILRGGLKEYPFMYDYGWIDLIGNFDYVNIIANLMILLIDWNAIGLYNIGTEIKSLYELGKMTKKTIKPSLRGDGFIKGHDVTMNLDKLNDFLKNVCGKTNAIR